MRYLSGLAAAAALACFLGCSSSAPTPSTGSDQPITPKLVLPPEATPSTIKNAAGTTTAETIPEPKPQPGSAAPTESQPAQTDPKVEPPPLTVATVQSSQAPASKPVANPLPFPTDRGGQLVLNALAPAPNQPAPVLKPQTAPKPRLSAVEQGELPSDKLAAKPISLPTKLAPPVKLTPPGERVNPDIGQANLLPPADIKVSLPLPNSRPVPRVPQLGADDVPYLARRVDDRSSLDDPTTDISTERIINTPMVLPVLQAAFLRLSIPDPFEWLEQLRGGTIPAEFSEKPVLVAPLKP